MYLLSATAPQSTRLNNILFRDAIKRFNRFNYVNFGLSFIIVYKTLITLEAQLQNPCS
jgi:hypothetical protein